MAARSEAAVLTQFPPISAGIGPKDRLFGPICGPGAGFRNTISAVEIHPSVRKHGIADEDIEHAARNAMTIDDLDDDLRLYLGPLAMPVCWRSSRSFVTTAPSWRSMR